MYAKILVPLDGSETAKSVLPMVRSLAAALNLPVQLLGVVETVGHVTPTEVQQSPGLKAIVESGRRRSQEYLEQVKQALPQATATCLVEMGMAVEVILEQAAIDPHALIAMATHGRSGLNRWLLGSVAEKVLRGTRNPLLMIRAADGEKNAKGKLASVVVPLDGSSLAERALPHARYLAQKLDLGIHLIGVYSLPRDAYLVGDGLLVSGPAEIRERMQGETQTYLDVKAEALRADGFSRISAAAIEGDPASEIIDFAQSLPDGLIAMSTHGRSGVHRWVLGSVTEKVIRYGKNPVLVIRPESLDTPPVGGYSG